MRRSHHTSNNDTNSYSSECVKKKRCRYSSTDTNIEDNSDGHLVFKPGDVLKRRFKVKQIVGEGTFAQVAHVVDLNALEQLDQKPQSNSINFGNKPPPNRLALKIIKNIGKYREAAKFEINVLDHIKLPQSTHGGAHHKQHHDHHIHHHHQSYLYSQKQDNRHTGNYCLADLNNITETGRRLCVQMLEWFDYHGHICILFEMLGRSVFDFMKMNNFQPFPIQQTKIIISQLLSAVNYLHSRSLCHTDLKPENILFVNDAYDIEYPSKSSSKVKPYIVVRDPTIRLIDFGSATFDHEHHSKIVSTRHYRAIEVILELGWSHPCDIWSVGCILFELYTGITMFQTHDNREHLAMMERILGAIPWRMATKSKTKYFNRHGWLICDENTTRWVSRNCRKLDDYRANDTREEIELFSLITHLLEYEVEKRYTAIQALEHPFFWSSKGMIRSYSSRDRQS